MHFYYLLSQDPRSGSSAAVFPWMLFRYVTAVLISDLGDKSRFGPSEHLALEVWKVSKSAAWMQPSPVTALEHSAVSAVAPDQFFSDLFRIQTSTSGFRLEE